MPSSGFSYSNCHIYLFCMNIFLVEHSFSHCILLHFVGEDDVMERILIERHDLPPFNVLTIKSQTHLQISWQHLSKTFIQTGNSSFFNNYCLSYTYQPLARDIYTDWKPSFFHNYLRYCSEKKIRQNSHIEVRVKNNLLVHTIRHWNFDITCRMHMKSV